MYTLENIKEFLNNLGYNWNYEYLRTCDIILTAKTIDDVSSKYLSKVFVITKSGVKGELKVGLNEHKFMLYKKEQNNIFANEKEENHSVKWQEFLKTKKSQEKDAKEIIK